MTPNLIDCPVCHTPNPATATQCTRCATPITSADATILGNELAEDAKLASETAAGEAIFTANSPQDQDATLSGDQPAGDVTDMSGAQGWSRPAQQASGATFLRTGRLAPH